MVHHVNPKILHRWNNFFPKIRFFPSCITFSSLRNQNLISNFIKILSAVFEKNWCWLTDLLAYSGAFIRPFLPKNKGPTISIT